MSNKQILEFINIDKWMEFKIKILVINKKGWF